jgi:predicted ArsR family transcriptional regulator
VNQKLISQIGKSQRLRIINELKRSTGLSVRELSDRLKMSYMGVKQHCLDLEKERYLDTWRRPKGVGRPEMVYRLTMRANELFPQTSNAMTIELLHAAQVLYGPTAAEKLLFTVFQRKTEHYAARMKGDTLAARAKTLAKIRDADGFMSSFREDGQLRIVECHTPLLDLLREFPILERLESDMMQRVLHTPVRREEKSVGGLYECTFYLS